MIYYLPSIPQAKTVVTWVQLKVGRDIEQFNKIAHISFKDYNFPTAADQWRTETSIIASATEPKTIWPPCSRSYQPAGLPDWSRLNGFGTRPQQTYNYPSRESTRSRPVVTFCRLRVNLSTLYKVGGAKPDQS